MTPQMKPKPAGWEAWSAEKKVKYDSVRYRYELAQQEKTLPKSQQGTGPHVLNPHPYDPPAKSNSSADDSAGGTPGAPINPGTTAGKKTDQKALDDWKQYLDQDPSKVNPFTGNMTGEDILRGYGAPLGDENFQVPGTADPQVKASKASSGDFFGDAFTNISNAVKGAVPPSDKTLADMRRYWLDQYLKGNEDDIRKFQKQLIQAGYLDPTDNNYQPGKILAVNDPTMKAANQLWSQSIKQNRDYKEVLSDMIAEHGKDPGKTVTKTTSQVSLSNASDITDTATTIFQRLMGRDPNPGEIDSLLKPLNAAEQANPLTTTTTDTTTIDDNANPNTTESSTSSGGVNPVGNLTEQVKSGYGPEVQTHGENTFMGALLGLMGMNH